MYVCNINTGTINIFELWLICEIHILTYAYFYFYYQKFRYATKSRGIEKRNADFLDPLQQFSLINWKNLAKNGKIYVCGKMDESSAKQGRMEACFRSLHLAVSGDWLFMSKVYIRMYVYSLHLYYTHM